MHDINPINRDAERRRNAIPTRDGIVMPTMDQHHRRKREDAERMAAFYIERAESVRRAQGGAPLSDEEKLAISKEYGAA